MADLEHGRKRFPSPAGGTTPGMEEVGQCRERLPSGWPEGPGEGEEKSTESRFIPHSPAKLPDKLLSRARTMRTHATDAENLLWQLLRNRRLGGAKFRRQHLIGRYIADFYSNEHSLVIELDGGQHMEQRHYDEQRTSYLQNQGLTVLRFWNNQVLIETESVLQAIWEQIVMR
jgi:adenine-specific DNA-methyltransferase